MADLTPRQLAREQSDLESGEERDDSDAEDAASPAAEAQSTAMKKRKRGKVWQDVNVDSDLSQSLAKVSTVESAKTSFVDLDAPTASVEESTERAAAYQNNIRSNSVKRPCIARHQCGLGPVQLTNVPVGKPPSASGSAVRVGEKRKNTMKPKSKRKTPGHSGGNVTTYFSLYPDWSSEVNEHDSLDIAARKAVHQLKEKFNPGTITQIVMHVGNAETKRLLQMTKTIEQHGGMLTIDNKCRRTPGGVFITLFKSDAEKQMGKEAVRALLAKPKEGINKELRAAKKARAAAKRATRQAAAKKEQSIADHSDEPKADSLDVPVPVIPSVSDIVEAAAPDEVDLQQPAEGVAQDSIASQTA